MRAAHVSRHGIFVLGKDRCIILLISVKKNVMYLSTGLLISVFIPNFFLINFVFVFFICYLCG